MAAIERRRCARYKQKQQQQWWRDLPVLDGRVVLLDEDTLDKLYSEGLWSSSNKTTSEYTRTRTHTQHRTTVTKRERERGAARHTLLPTPPEPSTTIL